MIQDRVVTRHMDEALKISWYGRCCFLLEHKDTKVLLDPYDSFCQVDIGTINANLVVISSTWHDHGHIGASPKAHVYSYPGKYDHNGIKITGIGAKEERGSPTTVFNIRMGGFSVTNFADFHSKEKTQFDHSLSTTQIEVLQSSNIIFARPSIVGNKITDNNIHNESFLEFCSPAIIIPEHYFPKSFIEEKVPQDLRQDFLSPIKVVDEMIESFSEYEVVEVDNFQIAVDDDELGGDSKKVIKFLRLHDQVNYVA